MRSLISAILESVVLIVSVIIVFIAANCLGYENPYENYNLIYPDSTLTPGIVLVYFPEGTNPTPEEASVILWEKIISEKLRNSLVRDAMPLPIAKLFCIKIGKTTAKALQCSYMIVIVEIVLCFIFGITLPASILKGRNLIEESLADTSQSGVFIDWKDKITGQVTEITYGDLEGLAKLLCFCVLVIATIIWCIFMPLVIAVNLALFLIPTFFKLIFGLVFSKSDDADKKAKEKK